MVLLSSILPDFAGFVITHGSLHLRLIKQLGSGAYGVVYLAQDLSPRPHRPHYFAVKCLLRHSEGSDLARQQHREIVYHRAVSGHRNIVSLHAVIEEEFYTFLVLDLCEGSDLFSAILERDTYLNNTSAVKRTFLQIIDALAACHAKGIYHRDLKPENILCSKDDQHVYLSDFGFATRTKYSTNFGCGSSFYMSPECLGIYHKKNPYATEPSDVWALGIILCNLLTGRNPWHIASPKTDKGFRLYMRDGPKWLHENLSISVGAAEILGRIFDLDPTTRVTLPELREAILAIETFYPGTEVFLAPVASVSSPPQHVAAALSATQADIAYGRPVNTPGYHQEHWDLKPTINSSRPSAVHTFSSPNSIAAAVSVTLAGTVSMFVNCEADAHDIVEDEVWSLAGPPPLAASPEPSSDDSEGPITPETHPVDPELVSTVESDFSLDDGDGRAPQHIENVASAGRVGAFKLDKRFARSFGRLMSTMRTRGIRIWA